MKAYELIKIPAQPTRTDLKAVAVICDLCSATIKYLYNNGVTRLNPQIVEHFGDATDVVIELKAGERYIDGGVGEITYFELCPGCFEDRLRPWLEQQGAEAKVESWPT